MTRVDLARRWAVWAALSVALWVPVLSRLGFAPFGAEVLMIGVGLAVLAALPALLVDPFGRIGGILVGLYGAAYVLFFVPTEDLNPVLLGMGLSVLLWFGWRQPKPASLVAIASGLAGLFGAALQPQPMFTTTRSASIGASDTPTVIHILLDEHASDWGLPDHVIPRAERDALWARYVARGFTVFDRSYSNAQFTPRSVSAMFNPGLRDPDTGLFQRAPSV